jgi:hypothetical protein
MHFDPRLIHLSRISIAPLPQFSYLQKSDRSSCYETCQRRDKKILSDPKNRSIH